jgi:hypothetical protein
MLPVDPAKDDSAKASIAVALLAFVVAAFALCHGEAGLTALVATVCGFALLFARLRQEREQVDARLGLAEDLAQASELMERGAYRQALNLTQRVAELSQSARVQCRALEVIAWCQLALDRPEAARNALSCLNGADVIDPYCYAAVEDACGHSLWALHIVERAAQRRQLSREATLFRIDLYARLRGIEAACALTLSQLGKLRRQDAERVLDFARDAGKSRAALALARALGQPLPAHAS